MIATRYFTPLLLISCLTFMACQKGCGAKKDLTKTEQVMDEKKVVDHKKPTFITDFNSLDFSGLTSTQVDSIKKLFNEEICPCGCPKSFAECINMKSGCKPAQLLAQWSINQLKQGVPEQYLYKAISEEINAGYSVGAKLVDTKGAYQKGREDAPITIVEFADFECPACKIAALEMKDLIEAHPDIQIYFMHFPLSMHPNAEKAAIAAEAAGKQGKFWRMHDLLFAYNGQLSEQVIKDVAAQIFDMTQMTQFMKDLNDPNLRQKIKDQREYGETQLNLLGTPTFLFNGRPYHLSVAKDGFELRLAMEKVRAEIDCQASE